MTEKSIIKSMNNRIVLASPFKRHDRMVSNLCWRLGTDVVRIEKCIDLLLEQLDELRPDYIFFPHWSWKIPDEIHHNYECVIFHMTDLPFGRGGISLLYLHRLLKLRMLLGILLDFSGSPPWHRFGHVLVCFGLVFQDYGDP